MIIEVQKSGYWHFVSHLWKRKRCTTTLHGLFESMLLIFFHATNMLCYKILCSSKRSHHAVTVILELPREIHFNHFSFHDQGTYFSCHGVVTWKLSEHDNLCPLIIAGAFFSSSHLFNSLELD